MTVKVTEYKNDGSRGNRLIFTFSHNLTEKQKEVFVRRIKARCLAQIRSTAWQSNKRLRVEVFYSVVADAGCIDIRRAVEQVATQVRTAP